MINSILDFSQSPLGTIIIRALCILFIGAMGFKMFLMKMSDLFELFAKSTKRKKAIELIADMLSIIGTCVLSILVSYRYGEGETQQYIILEGLFYGLGSVGVYQFIIDGKLIKFIRAWKQR